MNRKLYLELFQLIEKLHVEGDRHQRKLADKLSTLTWQNLDKQGLKPEDIEQGEIK